MRKEPFFYIVATRVLICLCIWGYYESKQDKRYSHNESNQLPSELQNIIRRINVNACKKTESSPICIIIDFFERNDSNFIWVTYDLSHPIYPPLNRENNIEKIDIEEQSLVYIDNYWGLYEYEKNVYLLFYNRREDSRIIKKAIGNILLDSNIDNLKELYKKSNKYEFCDGQLFLYLINDHKYIELVQQEDV